MYRTKTTERDLLPPGMKYALYSETGERCAHCGKHMAYADSTVDHIVPISKGGTNEKANLAILCEDCNKDKYNHVIDPRTYYKYLPEKRLAEIQKMFDAYLEDAEWLGWENLFKTDRFELTARRGILSPKSHKMFMAPVTVQVRKMLPKDAFDWLQVYRAHIGFPDRDLIIDDPRNIEHPFYEIILGRTPVGVFECYVGIDKGIVSEDELPCIMMNFFSHWDLKYRAPTSEYTMFYIVQAVMNEMQDTVMRAARRSLIGFRFTGLYSDPHIRPLVRIVPRRQMHPFEQSDFEGLDPDARTAGFTAILFQGDHGDILDMMAEQGVSKEAELYDKADRKALAQPVLDQLSGQPEDAKPDKILYNEMPGGYAPKKKRQKRHKHR